MSSHTRSEPLSSTTRGAEIGWRKQLGKLRRKSSTKSIALRRLPAKTAFDQCLPVVLTVVLTVVRTLVLGAAGGWLRGKFWSNVNHFSTPSVVELLARFLLDGGRIGFERSDLIDVLIVFFLHALDLSLERLHLGVLLAIDDHAVRSEHGVQQQPYDKKDSGRVSQTAPPQREP